MSPEDYEPMPTERLLQLFLEAARLSGVGRVFQSVGGDAPADAPTPTKEETKRGFGESAAIAAALRLRATKRDIEPLLESDDPDVRMCAAAFLGDFAPALAEAARSGVIANLPTREVLARTRRARKPPPARPTLQEMSDEALLARFQDACERKTAYRFIDWETNQKETATRNAIIDELTAILSELKRRDALAKLLPHLDSPDPSARFSAAQGCIRVATDKAAATLAAIEAEGDLNSRASAGDVLAHWRKGDCLIDKL